MGFLSPILKPFWFHLVLFLFLVLMLHLSKPELCALIQWFCFTFEPMPTNIFFPHISSYLITDPSKTLVYFTKDGIALPPFPPFYSVLELALFILIYFCLPLFLFAASCLNEGMDFVNCGDGLFARQIFKYFFDCNRDTKMILKNVSLFPCTNRYIG